MNAPRPARMFTPAARCLELGQAYQTAQEGAPRERALPPFLCLIKKRGARAQGPGRPGAGKPPIMSDNSLSRGKTVESDGRMTAEGTKAGEKAGPSPGRIDGRRPPGDPSAGQVARDFDCGETHRLDRPDPDFPQNQGARSEGGPRAGGGLDFSRTEGRQSSQGGALYARDGSGRATTTTRTRRSSSGPAGGRIQEGGPRMKGMGRGKGPGPRDSRERTQGGRRRRVAKVRRGGTEIGPRWTSQSDFPGPEGILGGGSKEFTAIEGRVRARTVMTGARVNLGHKEDKDECEEGNRCVLPGMLRREQPGSLDLPHFRLPVMAAPNRPGTLEVPPAHGERPELPCLSRGRAGSRGHRHQPVLRRKTREGWSFQRKARRPRAGTGAHRSSPDENQPGRPSKEEGGGPYRSIGPGARARARGIPERHQPATAGEPKMTQGDRP